jgi:hypothetical protein
MAKELDPLTQFIWLPQTNKELWLFAQINGTRTKMALSLVIDPQNKSTLKY